MERHRYGRHRAQHGEPQVPVGAGATVGVAVLIHGGFWRAAVAWLERSPRGGVRTAAQNH